MAHVHSIRKAIKVTKSRAFSCLSVYDPAPRFTAMLIMACENNLWSLPTAPPWALGLDSCSACTRVKFALKMNKLYNQMNLTHMHEFKGQRAETRFLQHREPVGKSGQHTHTQQLYKLILCAAWKEIGMLHNIQVVTCKQIFIPLYTGEL